ncbi:MAG: acetate/propionate family kinase [Burkholderiales bacterium]
MSEPSLLTINAGSSSIKFALFSAALAPALSLRGEIDGLGATSTPAHFVAQDVHGAVLADVPVAQVHDHQAALAYLLDWLLTQRAVKLVAAGHRVVHGGEQFAKPQLVDASVMQALTALAPLAPLHQPHNLAAIRALQNLLPSLPQVACFDTSFHSSQGDLVRNFALPRELTAAGVRRYGFHGLSYEHIASVLPDHLGSRASGRIVVMHLGNGASMCAMHAGKSIASSMGFTALDGLMMGTRCGNIDPGVLLYLVQEKNYSMEKLTDLLYRQSGLLGVSGISADMRILRESSDPHAREAIDLFVYRIGRELGSMAAALGGLDGLVFTGGIGEHDIEVRRRVGEAAAWLGTRIDAAANQSANGSKAQKISTAQSAIEAWIIPTNEESIIARHAAALFHSLTHTAR